MCKMKVVSERNCINQVAAVPVHGLPGKAKLIDMDFHRWFSQDLGVLYWTVRILDTGYFNDIGLLFYQSTSATKVNPAIVLNNGTIALFFSQENYGNPCDGS